jgi:hypothetical protein
MFEKAGKLLYSAASGSVSSGCGQMFEKAGKLLYSAARGSVSSGCGVGEWYLLSSLRQRASCSSE